MLLDGGGIGEQAVDRDQGRKGGEEREQAIEGDTSSDRQDAILVDLLVGAPEDVLPALGRDLVGRRGLSSTAMFPAGPVRVGRCVRGRVILMLRPAWGSPARSTVGACGPAPSN